jgi:hypothetical protein
MTLRTDLTNAISLSEALDHVTAALTITSNPGLTQTLELAAPGRSGVLITVNIAAATLTTDVDRPTDRDPKLVDQPWGYLKCYADHGQEEWGRQRQPRVKTGNKR